MSHTHTSPFSQEKSFIQIQNGLTSVTGSFLFLFFLATPALMGLRKTKQHPRRMATMPSVCARWCRWARAGGLTPGTISRQEVWSASMWCRCDVTSSSTCSRHSFIITPLEFSESPRNLSRYEVCVKNGVSGLTYKCTLQIHNKIREKINMLSLGT